MIIYLFEIDSGEAIAGDDAEEVKFVPLEEIPDMFFECFNKAMKKYKEKH